MSHSVNIFINFHITPIEQRNVEIRSSIIENVRDPNISKIHIIRTQQDNHNIESDKIVDIILDTRPTYKKLFEIANAHTSSDDVNVILNSDCFFTENFIQVIQNIKYDECYTLNRMEIRDISDRNSIWRMVGKTDSQDAWVFKGNIRVIGGDFFLGIPGCDNRICYDIHKSSYKLINPLNSEVFVYHYHNDAYRSYNASSDRLPLPYALVRESVINVPSKIDIWS